MSSTHRFKWRMKYLIIFILIFTCFLGSTEENSYQSLSIRFKSKLPHSQWQAKAINQAVEKFVSGYKKLRVVPVEQDQKSDYFWSGMLIEDTLNYKIVESESEAQVSSGSFVVGESMSHIQIQALGAIKPLIRNGGLIDQKLSQLSQEKIGLPDSIANLLRINNPKSLMSLFSLLGGVVWGLIILICFSFIFGTLHGVERIWHWNVKQLFLSWVEMSLLKLFGVIL